MTDQEQYLERLTILVKKELELYIRYAVRLREDGAIRHIYQTKLFKDELSNILEDDFQCMDRNAYEIERSLLSEEWEIFHEEAYQSIKRGVMIPFEYMLRRLGLTAFEKHCACLAAAPELNREFERMYCYLQDDYTFKYPALDLCIKMFTMDARQQTKLIHQVFQRKERLQCVFQAKPHGLESELSWKLKLRKDLISYLFFYESDIRNPKAEYELWVPSGKKYEGLNVNAETARRLEYCLREEPKEGMQILILQGASGSGKKLQVRLAAQAGKRTAFFFDLRVIRQKNAEQKREKILDAVVRAVLDQSCVCFCHWEECRAGDSWDRGLISEILKTSSLFFSTVFLTTDEDIPIEESLFSVYRTECFSMEMPAVRQRILLWKEFLGHRTKAHFSFETLAAQFDFTPGMMEEAAEAARKKADAEEKIYIEDSHIYEACQERLSHRLGERASRVHAAYTWEDLVLEEEPKQLLRQACAQISFQYRVYEEWGFQKKLAYGRGVSMLFAGPPGTGKTMAAQVLARELNLELYKVDLSGVLSKYIGETQKNLREIFDEVQKSRSILFFDEADVLFGKRVNVTDARDISANAQTAYLLQKMEEYDGITILATNLLQNFDDAYKRRIKYIISFTFPRAEQRKELWEKIFPEEMPLGEDIDTEYLASNFELSGAAIKNIALNAAFIAASEQKVTGMEHIMISLQQEYKKAGKTLGKEELKEYYIYKK